jgi:hypothetical protein
VVASQFSPEVVHGCAVCLWLDAEMLTNRALRCNLVETGTSDVDRLGACGIESHALTGDDVHDQQG